MTARPELALTLQFRDARHRALLPRHRVARWIRAALGLPARLAVRVVGEVEGRALNRDFRGRDYATNVLTFVYDPGQPLAGDIVLCAPVVAREARQQGKTLPAHYAHLLVHGFLHLQGFAHDTTGDAEQMESLETAVMAALGFPDPYRADQTG